MSRARLVASMILLLALVRGDGTSPAWAEDRTQAREAYRTASKHYDLGEFVEALAGFKEAYRYFEEPSLLFNIGQCHRQLGQREAAVRFFRTYLNKLPRAPNRAAVEEMITKLSEEQAHEVQMAASTTAPRPAAPVERAPEPTPTPPPPTSPPPTAAAPAPAPTPAPAASLTATAPTPAKRTPVYKKWWLWTTVGVVVVAGVGVGLALGLRPHDPTATTGLGTVKPDFQ